MLFLVKYDLVKSSKMESEESTTTSKLMNVNHENGPMAVNKLKKHYEDLRDPRFTYNAINVELIETI